MKDEILAQAEKATGLPLRLALISLITIADRNGVFKCELANIEENATPLEDWDWPRILDLFDAAGYLTRWPANAIQTMGFLRGWYRLQTPHEKEKTTLPEPPDRYCHLTPQAQDWRRWAKPIFPPLEEPLDRFPIKINQPYPDLGDKLWAAANANVEPAALDLGPIKELLDEGIPLKTILATVIDLVAIGPKLQSWGAGWLLAAIRLEHKRSGGLGLGSKSAEGEAVPFSPPPQEPLRALDGRLIRPSPPPPSDEPLNAAPSALEIARQQMKDGKVLLCSDCPPPDYPATTRCLPCPRRIPDQSGQQLSTKQEHAIPKQLHTQPSQGTKAESHPLSPSHPRPCEDCEGLPSAAIAQCLSCAGTGKYCPHGVRNWHHCQTCASTHPTTPKPQAPNPYPGTQSLGPQPKPTANHPATLTNPANIIEAQSMGTKGEQGLATGVAPSLAPVGIPWPDILDGYAAGNLAWDAAWGPKPGHPACLVPEELLREAGITVFRGRSEAERLEEDAARMGKL